MYRTGRHGAGRLTVPSYLLARAPDPGPKRGLGSPLAGLALLPASHSQGHWNAVCAHTLQTTQCPGVLTRTYRDLAVYPNCFPHLLLSTHLLSHPPPCPRPSSEKQSPPTLGVQGSVGAAAGVQGKERGTRPDPFV